MRKWNIERVRLIAISEIVGNTWTYQGLPIKIGRAIKVGSWDRGPQLLHNRSRWLVFTESDGPRFSRGNSLIKWCSSHCKLNSWLNREQIKRFWSIILSSSQFPCILDSSPIGLRQDWLRIVAWFDRILPLNAERTWGRNQANPLQSTWIEAKFLRQPG